MQAPGYLLRRLSCPLPPGAAAPIASLQQLMFVTHANVRAYAGIYGMFRSNVANGCAMTISMPSFSPVSVNPIAL